jgi:hypothetical protein
LDLRERKWREAGEDYIMRSFISYKLITRYYSGDDMKEDEIGGTCSTHGRDLKCIQYYGRKT